MEGNQHNHYRRNNPSLFFPILLITVGIIWMLVITGRVPAENVYRLYSYWPVLLIAGGLGILFQRISWLLNGLLWMSLAALTVWLVISPTAALPKVQEPQMTHRVFNTPLDGAKSADIQLNLSINPTEVKALNNSTQLINADVYYLGNMQYDASGSAAQMKVVLSQNFSGLFWNLPAGLASSQKEKWQIGLSPQVPLDLSIDGGTGSTTLDLSALQLNSLNVNGGTGSVEINLPEDNPSYQFQLNVGTGSARVTAPSGSVFNMKADGGTGSLVIDVPSDAGVQVDIHDTGMGSIHLPSDYQRTSGSSDNMKGVWENSAYAKTKSPIRIELSTAVGSVEVK